jgi:hypothetical protein
MFLRATIVVAFAAIVAAMMIFSPGPLFNNHSDSVPDFSNASADTMPMDFDDARTVELRREATSAMTQLINDAQKSP